MKKPSAVSTALFSLLIFLSIAVIQARKTPKLCSSSCGDIKNISYPFRLKEDPAACGDPDYELSCENNKTILNFLEGKYYVKRIFYDKRIIRVLDVNLANGDCSLPQISMGIDKVVSDGRYGEIVAYSEFHASFIRCSKKINDMVNREVPCLNGNTSYVYVNFSDYVLHDHEFPSSCKVISTVLPVYSLDKSNHASNETILKMLESGFDMGWSVDCRDCIADGGYCNFRSLDIPSTFSCNKEDYAAEDRLAITVFSAYILFGITSVSRIEISVFTLLPHFLELSICYIFLFFLVIIFTVRFILLPLVLIGFILHKYLSTRKKNDDTKHFPESQQPLSPQRYSYPDILAMSNNLKDKIGQGCFGSVYKGQLPGSCLIAVKLLESSKLGEEKFINEVSTISRIHHDNVVPFLGFCYDGSKRVFVYEYMPNGSLDKHIFSKDGNTHSFSWEKLHEIALGMARGIEFLHRGSDACIVHFDIKPQNILLDQSFIPKIADFGLAKVFPNKYDFVSITATNETIGYMAPELISRDFGAVSGKSDVYSFGMLLLEMASGRRNVDVDAVSSSKVHFPSWVYELNERGDLELDNVTKSEAIIARKLFIVGLWCTQTNSLDRPSMARVVEMLLGSIDDLEMPPKPVFFSPEHMYLGDPRSDSPNELLIPESTERST
ncbi:hypothetical protein CRYUN_Cryun21dG0088100 [Craigia yunnanensis]